MKSSTEQLKSRGFAPNDLDKLFMHKSIEELIELLQSPVAVDRTLSARNLGLKQDIRAIPHLTIALETEKKLYTKIEISNSLASFGTLAVPFLIPLLGKIGHNQHKEIDKELFKKNNYPLPRDIISRTLIRIGSKALSPLIDLMKHGNKSQISEAIDAIGYICFYNKQDVYLNDLIECYTNSTDGLIRWKIIRAMSGFPESISFLEKEFSSIENEDLHREIERVIQIIKNRKNNMSDIN